MNRPRQSSTMHRMVQRALILLLLATLVVVAPAPPTKAIAVTDLPHTIQTTIAAILRYRQLAQSIENDIRNLERLTEWNSREIYGVLAGFAQFLAHEESIVYTDQRFLRSRWFETFEPALPLESSIYPLGGDSLEEIRQDRTLDTLWGVMRGVRLQANNVSAGQQLIDRIKEQGAGAVGNLEAAQVGILIDAYQAEELAQMRQLSAARANVELVAQANRQSRRSQSIKALIDWLGLREDPPEIPDFASVPLAEQCNHGRSR